MGVKTLGAIVSEGMSLGGRTDSALATPVTAWVNNWLRQTYLQWPWPWLYKSRAALSLAAATESLSVGGGNGGITNPIQRVIDPIWVYDATGNKAVARVRKLTGGSYAGSEERIQVAANFTGIPREFRVRPGSSFGVWSLIPIPFPDRAYLLAFDYIELPANLTASDTPIYPNDLTVVQAALVATLLHVNGHDSPDYQDAIQVLAKRVSQDRTGFGNSLGINDTVELDEGVYS